MNLEHTRGGFKYFKTEADIIDVWSLTSRLLDHVKRELRGLRLDLVLFQHELDDLLRGQHARHERRHGGPLRRREHRRVPVVPMPVDARSPSRAKGRS